MPGDHKLWFVLLPHTSNLHCPAAPAPVEEPLISAAAHGLGAPDTHGAISDAMCIPNLAGGSPTVGDLSDGVQIFHCALMLSKP